MKNKLSDLNNHLFAQMERLCEEDLKGDALQEEIKRATAVTLISTQIIENAKTCIKGYEIAAEYGFQNKELLSNLLEDKSNE